MSLDTEMKWFADTSKLLGSDIDLVQGTGGNVSVKLENRKMVVKASGVRLSDVSEASGCVVVDHRRIADAYSGKVSEEDAAKIIRSSVVSGTGRPSIETAMHSILGKYVIHLHPVSINVVLCSTYGRDIISDIFDDYLWVPYARVGHFLAREIRDRLGGEELIFLENHGIIVSSEDSKKCVDTLGAVRSSINAYLKSSVPGFYNFAYKGLTEDEGTFVNPYISNAAVFEKFLFPDAAVFAASEKIRFYNNAVLYFMDRESAKNIDEVVSAHAYLHEMTERIGGPKYLGNEDVSGILGMESEKYRRRVLGL